MGISLGFGLDLSGAETPDPSTADTYDSDAEAFFSNLSPEPNDTYKGYYNDLIRSLKTSGVWDKLDALYIMATGNESWAKQNLVQNLFNLSAINSPTFTTNGGFTGDGSTSYLSTGFRPSRTGIKYSLDSAHFSIWSLGTISSSAVPIGARTSSSSQQTLMVPALSSGQFRINQDDSNGTFTMETSGFMLGSRVGSSEVDGYNNTTNIGTSPSTSTGLTTQPIYIGALNNGGSPANYCSAQIAAASIGSGLDSDEEASLYDAINTFLTSVGAV